MRLKYKAFVAIALCSTACVPFSAAFANTQDAEEGAATSDEIVVSARKKEELLANVPVTVSVVTSEKLFDQRVNDLRGLAASVPNLNMASDTAIRSRITIRGIGGASTGAQGAGVGVYVDGIFQSTSSSLNAPFFDLERVEVLKGPQGTLYGRNAMAGVINYITPKPGSELEVVAEGEVANFDTYRLAGAVSIPIAGDTLALRLSGQHMESDGPWKYTTGENLSRKTFDAFKGRLLFRPSPGFEFDLIAGLSDLDAPGLQITRITDALHLNTNQFNLNSPNIVKNQNRYVNLGSTFDLGSVQIVSRTGYDWFKSFTDADSDYSASPSLWTQLTSTTKSFSQELRLQSTGSGPFQWLVGGAYVKETTDGIDKRRGTSQDTSFGVGNGILAFTDETKKVWSGFFDATFAVSDQLELGAGLRYDDNVSTIDRVDNVAVLATEQILSINSTFTGRFKESSWQPKFTVRYKFSPELSAFATAAKGYRQGGFNRSLTNTVYASYIGDTLWNYEVGLKWKSPNGKAGANLSLFYIDQSRVSGSVTVPNQFNAATSGVANFGTARSYGVEFDAFVKATDNLSLTASAGAMNCEYKRVSLTVPGIVSGAKCVDNVAWNFRVAADFEQPVSDSLALTIGANLSGRGDARIGIDSGNNPLRQVQPSYYLANASLGVKGKGWRAFGYVDNIFDERYATYLTPRSATVLYATIGMPRTFGVRVRFDY